MIQIGFLLQLPLVALIAGTAFIVTGSYKGVIRHTGVQDVYNIFNAICLSSILNIFLVIVNRQVNFMEDFTIPLSIIIIHSLISFIALTTSRYIFKSLYYNLIRGFKATKNVLIYGAGEAGVLTFNALTTHSASSTKVIGYIDDDRKKVGKNLNGVRVYGREELTAFFIDKNNIIEIIISIHSEDNIFPERIGGKFG